MSVSYKIVPFVGILAHLCISVGTAKAQSFGSGEAITHLTSLPKSSPAYAEYNKMPEGPFVPGTHPTLSSIGFKYTELHVFVPVWTSGGEYVVYSGKQYVSVGTDAPFVAAKLGVSEEVLVKPFFYRFPFGLIFGAGMILVLGTFSMIGRAFQSRRVEKFLTDSRYQHALMIANDPNSGGINAAVDYLHQRGVPLKEAHENLVKLLARGESISV